MAITPGEALHSWRNRAAKQGFITCNRFLTCTFTPHVRKVKLHFITDHAKEKRESLCHGSHEQLLIDTLSVSILCSFLKKHEGETPVGFQWNRLACQVSLLAPGVKN